MERIAQNIADIKKTAKNTVLIAVSKKQPASYIQAALDAGQRVFGENRVQEAQEHWTAHKAAYPDLELHLIGPLQTNKVTDAVALFDVIQTVDREKLVDALVKEMDKQSKPIPCFIQVNTGEEEQKGGVVPDGLESLHQYAVNAGLNITGLMCIPPANEPAVPHFGLLRVWAQRLSLPNLSMGMSSDYEDAVRLGATHIRVGSALFGERQS